MLPYPRVATTVGKKFVTEPEATIPKSMTMRIHILMFARLELELDVHQMDEVKCVSCSYVMMQAV